MVALDDRLLLPGWDATDALDDADGEARTPAPVPGPMPAPSRTPPGTLGLRILGVSEVARAVRSGGVDQGILVCGTGIGMSIVANKYRGIRAALCTTEFEARMARAHNDANVLCLGQRVVGPGLGRVILEAFLDTPFEGGRHQNRVKKIHDAEAEQ